MRLRCRGRSDASSLTRGGDAHVAQLTLRQARIAGGLQNYENLMIAMPPTRILGEVDLSFAELGNYAQFDGFFITGDLEFGATTAQSKDTGEAPRPTDLG